MEQQLREAIASLDGKCKDLLRELVGARSLQGEEKGAQDMMERVLRDELDMKIDRWTMSEETLRDQRGFSPVSWPLEQSECVVGTLEAVDEKAASLIINGHVDVVPVQPATSWTRDPFETWEKDGWFYGRGAGDMKGGIVAALVALLALKQLGWRPAGRLHFQSVPEEECSGNGTLACCVRGYSADAALIPEPFADVITTGQCGVMWMTIILEGQPCHVLDTRAGVSAIEAAYAVYERLKQEERELNEPSARHAAYAQVERPINFNLGEIRGGNWASSVASHCEMRLRVGAYPDDDLDERQAHLTRVVLDQAATLNVKAQVRWEGFKAEGYVADASTAFFSTLARSFETAAGRKPQLGLLTCTTDARFFHLYHHTPAACLGPAAQRIHGVDECVSLASIAEVALSYALFIEQWQGLSKI